MSIDALLPQAMEQITQQTGVPVKADPAVWDLLPWGRDTNIKAKIENHLSQYLLDPQVNVDVLGFNSKVFYVILDGGGYGQQVLRLPIVVHLARCGGSA